MDTAATGPAPARTHLALGLFVVSLLLTLAAAILHLTGGAPPGADQWGLPGFEGILAIVTAGVGYLIARRTSNPTGWIFSTLGVFSGVQYLAEQYATVGLPPGSSLPGAVTVAWVAEWIWVPLIAGIGALLLLFPDDRIGSRPGRAIAAAGALSGAAVFFAAAFLGPRVTTWDVPNPYAINGDPAAFDLAFNSSAMVMMLAVVAAAIRLVARLRVATGVRRQQLKWFAYAAVFASISLVFGAIPATTAVGSKFAVIGIVGIAAACAVAVLRYRLYDIDVVINRTLVYLTLTAVLAAAYAAFVFLFGLVMRPITGDSTLAVAASTIAVAALFRPLRVRIQEFIDRRFARRRYDSRVMVDRLKYEMRDAMDLPTLEAIVVNVVNETVAPRAVALWLRPR